MTRAAAPRLLLLGVSVRALAESAASGRLAPRRFPGGLLALDYFGDADLLALAWARRDRPPLRALSLRRDLGRARSALALARAALELDWDAFAYAGGLENRPRLLRALQARGAVLGNGAAEVGQVRDPAVLFPFLRRAGIPHAATWTGAAAAKRPRGVRCLWKPLRSGGGGGVRGAAEGERRPRGHYMQQFLPGPVGSAAFLADGARALLLGVTEQIPGWRELGGSGFRYGGNIAGPPDALVPPGALATLAAAAEEITRRFGLRGLNGLDFVVAAGVPRIIEVNPRYTASMELLEEISGRGFFDLHLRALEGSLPRTATEATGGPRERRRQARARFLGKGILYADRNLKGSDPEALSGLGCRDIPVRGEPIARGQPVCTIVAGGASPDDCRREIAARAGRVRRLLLSAETSARQGLSAPR
ncbi:MAG: ATP-grasp domain-containing protein [Acidobacteria bacterium]|nr:ATP-grasp domain-containing protein [Acidobacteriota bacterium]